MKKKYARVHEWFDDRVQADMIAIETSQDAKDWEVYTMTKVFIDESGWPTKNRLANTGLLHDLAMLASIGYTIIW